MSATVAAAAAAAAAAAVGDAWDLFSSDSSSGEGEGAEEVDDTEAGTGTATTGAAPRTPDPWMEWVPRGLRSDGQRIHTRPNIPWHHTALQAPAVLRAPFHAPLQFQSSAVKFHGSAEGVGGGRAFYAAQDIAPGTLLLREAVSVPLPSARASADLGLSSRTAGLLHHAIMSEMVESSAARQRHLVVEDMRVLFPRSLSDLSEEYLTEARQQFGNDLSRLAHILEQNDDARLMDVVAASNGQQQQQEKEEAKQAGRNDEDEDEDDGDTTKQKLLDGLLCLLCSIHCNAFVNGMHMHLAMLNHSCRPNCVKLGRKSGQAGKKNNGGDDGPSVSEIWSTEPIACGEEITISYLLPRMQSPSSRQLKLKKQFEFDCRCRLCSAEATYAFSASTVEARKVEAHVEEALEVDCARASSSGTFVGDDDDGSKQNVVDLVTRLKWALELHDMMMGLSPSSTDMGKDNLVCARLCGLIAKLCRRVLQGEDSDEYNKLLDLPATGSVALAAPLLLNLWTSSSSSSSSPAAAVASATTESMQPLPPKMRIAAAFLSFSLLHFQTQFILQGPCPHAEMATTLGDISGAARVILGHSSAAVARALAGSPEISKWAPTRQSLARLESFCGRAATTIGDRIFLPTFELGLGSPQATAKTCHLVCGAPASGKTHVAKILAGSLPRCVAFLDSDVVASRLVSAGLKLAKMDPDDRDSLRYKDAFRDPVYQTMFDLARDNLSAATAVAAATGAAMGAAVVMCGPFTRECNDPDFPAWLHERLGGASLRIELHFVACDDDTRRRERMTRRGAPRDQSKLASDEAWAAHLATCSSECPVWPHHFFDNTAAAAAEEERHAVM
jgi:hypothetical protein